MVFDHHPEQLEILYADKDILVCIKPARVLSTDEPGGLPSLVRTALGDERVDSSSWPKRSLKFITNLVPHPNRHLLNVLG